MPQFGTFQFLLVNWCYIRLLKSLHIAPGGGAFNENSDSEAY